MSDQPRGRKRIAGRRPTRPAGTSPADAGTPQDAPRTPQADARTPEADALATASDTTPDAPAVQDRTTSPDETKRGAADQTKAENADDAGNAGKTDYGVMPEDGSRKAGRLSKLLDRLGSGRPDGTAGSPAEAEKAGASGAGGRSGRVLVGVLAALLVVTLGVGGVLGVQAWHGHQKEARRDAAAGAAAKAAALVLSYDYRKLPEDFGAARQTLTPEFAQKFDQTTKLVGEQATKTKATVKAEVREVSVSNSSADVVNVLLFVNQTTSSTVTQGKPRVDLNRARFTMVRSDGRWLVQEVAGL